MESSLNILYVKNVKTLATSHYIKEENHPASLFFFFFCFFFPFLINTHHKYQATWSKNRTFSCHTLTFKSQTLFMLQAKLVRTARRRGWIRLILLVLIWDWGLGATWSKTIPPHAHTSSSQLQTSQLIIATAPHLFVLSTKHPTSHNRKHSVANTSTSLASKVQLSLGGW